jgi:hypothetical protein
LELRVQRQFQQNPLGLGQWIILGRRARSYLSRDLQPRIWLPVAPEAVRFARLQPLRAVWLSNVGEHG